MKNKKEIKNIKTKSELKSSIEIILIYLISYIIFFIPSIIIYIKYGTNILLEDRIWLNVKLIHFPVIGFLIGVSEYFVYRKANINNKDIKKNNKQLSKRIIILNNIFSYLIYFIIMGLNFNENIAIFILSYCFVNIFNSLNIYDFFRSKYELKENEKILRYIKLIFGVLIINIAGIYTKNIISNLIYAFSVIIFTMPYILKDTLKFGENNKKIYAEKKINNEKENIKKRTFIEKIVSIKEVVYPYICTMIFQNIVIFLMIKKFGKNMLNLTDFNYVIKTILAYKLLIEIFAILIGLKVYDNYIEYGEKERITKNKTLIFIGTLFIAFFSLIVYIYPYFMLNMFTLDLAGKNVIINILKHFFMTNILSFISYVLIYNIYGKIKNNEIKKGRYNYKEMSKANKYKYNLNTIIFILKETFPFLLIFIAVLKQNYKLMLYSYFVSDIIVLIMIILMYLKEKNKYNSKKG